VKADREGGRPLELSIEELDVNGFTANQGWSKSKFMPPSIFYAYSDIDTNKPASSSEETKVTNCVLPPFLIISNFSFLGLFN